MRNPDWVRDEVILALDLYVRAGRKQLPPTHPDVVALSGILNRLPIHDSASRAATFRNPNGISMILGNFLGIDPGHTTPGLSRNNRLQEEVWADYAADEKGLRLTAEAILRAIEEPAVAEIAFLEWHQDDVFAEGEVLSRLHLTRERNREAVRRKKDSVLAKTGRLQCEACGFDFGVMYGPLGVGFAECHHTCPLAELPGKRETLLIDLAIVCANCHRMLHREKQRLTVPKLRQLVLETRGVGHETRFRDG
jgi:5-methylcytosine-specific restriction protein A